MGEVPLYLDAGAGHDDACGDPAATDRRRQARLGSRRARLGTRGGARLGTGARDVAARVHEVGDFEEHRLRGGGSYMTECIY